MGRTVQAGAGFQMGGFWKLYQRCLEAPGRCPSASEMGTLTRAATGGHYALGNSEKLMSGEFHTQAVSLDLSFESFPRAAFDLTEMN